MFLSLSGKAVVENVKRPRNTEGPVEVGDQEFIVGPIHRVVCLFFFPFTIWDVNAENVNGRMGLWLFLARVMGWKMVE